MKRYFPIGFVLIGAVLFQASAVVLAAAEDFRLDLRKDILMDISRPIMEVCYEDFSRGRKIPDLGQGWSDREMTVYLTEFFSKAFRLDLREDILMEISRPIMEVCYEDFSKGRKIPDLGQGWSDREMTVYLTEFFSKAQWEPKSWAAKVVKFSPDSQKLTVAKAAIDDLAQVFNREDMNLNKFLPEGFSAGLDAQGQTWTVTGPGFSGYHNNYTFDYTLNGVKINGDTATVTYNTYYSAETGEYFASLAKESPSQVWSFEIKPGLFKIHYKMIDGRLVLVKTEQQALEPFKFFTQ